VPEDDDARPPRPAPLRMNDWVGGASVARIALELVIVFVGVYAAFALTDYRERRVAEDRRQQLEVALVREIEDITRNTRRVAEWVPPTLVRFDSLVAAGARPPLEPMIEPVRVENHMWQATMQSGGLDLFDVPTIYRLSQFYNQLNAGFEQLAQLRELSETMLIPSLGRGPDEYYDPDTGSLRPRYRWYREGLHRLGELAASITTMGDTLVAELRQARPGPES
jgi:hypothetical protein